MHSLIYSLQQHHEVPINLLSSLQMSLLRYRKAKWLIRGVLLERDGGESNTTSLPPGLRFLVFSLSRGKYDRSSYEAVATIKKYSKADFVVF